MRKIIRARISIIFLLSVVTGTKTLSQTAEEWARNVNWDGASHWSKYIVATAANMGPNALPVPFISNGNIDSTTYLGSSLSFHTMKGDRSMDLSVYGNYCIVKNFVSVDFSYEPVEWYKTSDFLKKQRHVYFDTYYDSKARGDLHLNLNFKILKKWEHKLQMAMRIGYRYPASSGLASARYTDGMGYYFDFSFAKPLNPHLKWIGMAGFYCWQLNGDSHRQNDAFLFGSGLQWNKNGWQIQGYGAGYLGYLKGTGDKPIVLRAQVEKRYKQTGLLFRLQQGIHDFKYTSAELGARFFFKRNPPSLK